MSVARVTVTNLRRRQRLGMRFRSPRAAVRVSPVGRLRPIPTISGAIAVTCGSGTEATSLIGQSSRQGHYYSALSHLEHRNVLRARTFES